MQMPPDGPPDPTSLYARIGASAGIRTLVGAFYGAMDRLPEAGTIRALHADDLTADKHKLTAFLSGWMGGPQLYWQQYGHPQLRARHMHLPIDTPAAKAWLLCMQTALDETVAAEDLRQELMARFTRVAHHMRNTADLG